MDMLFPWRTYTWMIPGRVVKSKARKACVFIFERIMRILTRMMHEVGETKRFKKNMSPVELGFIKVKQDSSWIIQVVESHLSPNKPPSLVWSTWANIGTSTALFSPLVAVKCQLLECDISTW